jgi:hypothetical protein
MKLSGFLHKVRRKLNPYIITQPDFPSSLAANTKPLLITCGKGFDQTRPTAGTLWPIGLARGWADACGPAKLVAERDLLREIQRWEQPAVFMSIYNFLELSAADCRKLREVDLFIHSMVHPAKIAEWRKHSLLPEVDFQAIVQSYEKILLAQPRFFWNSSGPRGLYWTDGWVKDGVRWEQVFLAADPYRYYPEPNPARYGNVKMAYIGGYWPEKAQAYDQYLRPWEEILHVFSVDEWPYRNYHGQIDEVGERQVYSTAGLIPLVTTPAGLDVGELTERYFKAPACGAFCIADHNVSVIEAFSKDEMLQAESADHFHELVRALQAGQLDTELWRKRAHRAVMERHCYRHRAEQIRRALDN